MNDILHRKDRLIITTVDLINEVGLQGLTTREIAKREGVSEATLFRHYKNKNNLLLAVLDYFTKFDDDIFETTKLKKLVPMEAIRFLISSTVEYYENYPAITAITQLMDILQYEPDLSDKVKSIILKRSQSIKYLVEEAKRSGDIRPDTNSEDLSDVISGTFKEICLKWRINRDFSLKERVLSSINMVLVSFSN